VVYHWLAEDRRELQHKASNALALGMPQAAYTVAGLVWEAAGVGPVERPAPHRLIRSRVEELLAGFNIFTRDDE
jgi:hypothetical protein